jgi:hypothetical protein
MTPLTARALAAAALAAALPAPARSARAAFFVGPGGARIAYALGSWEVQKSHRHFYCYPEDSQPCGLPLTWRRVHDAWWFNLEWRGRRRAVHLGSRTRPAFGEPYRPFFNLDVMALEDEADPGSVAQPVAPATASSPAVWETSMAETLAAITVRLSIRPMGSVSARALP